MASKFEQNQFTIFVSLFHVAFLVLFFLFAKHDKSATPLTLNDEKDGIAPGDNSDFAGKYPMFQDTHVMIFIGFGFLMTFLKRYGFSAVSVNLLLACFTIEWGLIVRGLLSKGFSDTGRFSISVDELLTADFAAAVVLISMGAMLGKLSPVQYLIMAFVETFCAIACEHFVVHHLHINDIGGSLVVHSFGAYFGLACSRAFANKEQRGHDHEGSIYHTDIFAMIGAVFLWVFWPSFNAAVATPADARHRAVINTFLSLVACTIVTFLVSQAVDHKKRFNMVHIANSTLAGGVAIGTTANVILDPFWALIIGTIAGLLSVIGFQYITPFLSRKLAIHDTCGVNNLHGMPGLLAGLVGVAAAYLIDKDEYGSSVRSIYPKMNVRGQDDGGHTEATQALYQLAAIGVVLIVSLVSGFITGFILKLKVWQQVQPREYFSDGPYFETPADYDFTSRIMSNIDHIEISEKTQLTHSDKLTQ